MGDGQHVARNRAMYSTRVLLLEVGVRLGHLAEANGSASPRSVRQGTGS
jgi:hypothetical protein